MWRSLVARPLWERKAPGSNPGTPTRIHIADRRRWFVGCGAACMGAVLESVGQQVCGVSRDHTCAGVAQW